MLKFDMPKNGCKKVTAERWQKVIHEYYKELPFCSITQGASIVQQHNVETYTLAVRERDHKGAINMRQHDIVPDPWHPGGTPYSVTVKAKDFRRMLRFGKYVLEHSDGDDDYLRLFFYKYAINAKVEPTLNLFAFGDKMLFHHAIHIGGQVYDKLKAGMFESIPKIYFAHYSKVDIIDDYLSSVKSGMCNVVFENDIVTIDDGEARFMVESSLPKANEYIHYDRRTGLKEWSKAKKSEDDILVTHDPLYSTQSDCVSVWRKFRPAELESDEKIQAEFDTRVMDKVFKNCTTRTRLMAYNLAELNGDMGINDNIRNARFMLYTGRNDSYFQQMIQQHESLKIIEE